MSSYEKELIVQGKYTSESFCLEEDIYLIKKDNEELVKVIGSNITQKILKILQEQEEELEKLRKEIQDKDKIIKCLREENTELNESLMEYDSFKQLKESI